MANKNNENVWHRMVVKVKLPKFNNTYYFSNKDKEQLFNACTNFAHGLILGYLAADNSNFSVSTNEVQSIDGVFWWNSRTMEKVVYIEDETGKMIKTKEDLK